MNDGKFYYDCNNCGCVYAFDEPYGAGDVTCYAPQPGDLGPCEGILVLRTNNNAESLGIETDNHLNPIATMSDEEIMAAHNDDETQIVTTLEFELFEPAMMVISAICGFTYINEDGETRHGVLELNESTPIEMMGLAGLAMQHIYHCMGSDEDE